MGDSDFWFTDSDFWNGDLPENLVNRGVKLGGRLGFLVHRLGFLEWEIVRKPRKSWGEEGCTTLISGLAATTDGGHSRVPAER